jgi:hypothetical protein
MRGSFAQFFGDGLGRYRGWAMRHKSSEAAVSPAAVSAELSAHDGVRVAFPGLTAARPAIIEPLAVVMDAAYRELLLAMSPANSASAVEVAATRTYAELQALLAELEGQSLEGGWRRELWDAQAQPVFALPGQKTLAKRLQIEAAYGRPLTVCFGKRSRSVLTPAGNETRVYPFGDGCGLVHPDSTGFRRPSFRLYCNECRKHETARADAAQFELIARWQGRERVLASFPDRDGPVTAWHGKCTSCGRPYAAESARITRCERCRSGHR